MSPAPGFLRVQRLLLGLALHRWVNRFGTAFRRPPKEGEPRRGTARKGVVGGFWTVVLLGILVFQGAAISHQLLQKLMRRADVAAPADALPPPVVQALGAVLLLVFLCQLVTAFGGANQDLGRVEWTLEWLFGFPVSGAALFLAKAVEYAVVNAYTWVMTLPLLGVFLHAAGAGRRTLPLALAATLAFALMLGAVRLLAETWLRTRFSLEKLKNLQAACTLLGTLLLLALFGGAASSAVPGRAFDALLAFPAEALWFPIALPALLCGPQAPVAGAALALAAVAVVAGCTRLSQRLVRDGLLNSSGVYQGRRGRDVPVARVTGVLGKDLRVLFRDRNFLVQTLAIPLLVLGFQVFLNPGLLKSIGSDFRHAAAAAYGVGAYVLLCSAFHVLTVEGGTLWLLFTLPVPLDRILRRKALLWSGFAAAYTVILLGVATAYAPPSDWTALSDAVLAVVGVVIFAFTVAAIGALGTDPLQTEVQRRFRPDMAYLAMLLAGVFAWAIYSPSAWQKLVQTLLSSLLALALWQKVRDRIPYLLDPTEAPPPRITLSDGLIALLAFFVLQAFGTGLSIAVGAEPGLAVLLGYTLAGALVSLVSLIGFWRYKVPDLLRATGLRADRPGRLLPSLAWGLGAGVLAAGVAALYVQVLRRTDSLRHVLEETAVTTLDPRWIVVLAVVAAPLVEEFLFRGLILRGLRRTWGPGLSIVAGAALFAAVHPPAGFVPVFALGLAASIAFERSGWLLAPILCHALYNAAVFFVIPKC